MANLIAQGRRPDQRWRRMLPSGPIELGRQVRLLSVPWDRQVSRFHATVELVGDALRVSKNDAAANPIFFDGQETEVFTVQTGEHFVIGRTTFQFTNEKAEATLDLPEPAEVQAFSAQEIRNVSFSDADRRLAVLNDLPEIISSSTNEADLLIRVTQVLLAGVRSANTIGLVQIVDGGTIEVMHWDCRTMVGDGFSPSERLIRRAVNQGDTVLYRWDASADTAQDLTVQMEDQWAFVTPLDGQACRGWAIYVLGKTGAEFGSGPTSGAQEIQSDIKFTELVGAMVANLRDVQFMQRNQTALRSFFSPIVSESFAGRSIADALTPRRSDISVLFCDLRGFSRTSERLADNLLELLDRVSQALGVTTRQILATDGVVGDFHGDAVMGFWGWPFEQEDRVQRACQTALQIEREFRTLAADTDNPLSDFRIGIGIASGVAVAGQIGTSDQVKITAFGPTVNLAARLEGMTKQLKIPVLIDETSMRAVNADSDSQWYAIRLAKVRPAGMTVAVEVGQLVSADTASSFDFVYYEHALNLFSDGDWPGARKKMAQIKSDFGPIKFLKSYMDRFGTPPNDFEGVIDLTEK